MHAPETPQPVPLSGRSAGPKVRQSEVGDVRVASVATSASEPRKGSRRTRCSRVKPARACRPCVCCPDHLQSSQGSQCDVQASTHLHHYQTLRLVMLARNFAVTDRALVQLQVLQLRQRCQSCCAVGHSPCHQAHHQCRTAGTSLRSTSTRVRAARAPTAPALMSFPPILRPRSGWSVKLPDKQLRPRSRSLPRRASAVERDASSRVFVPACRTPCRSRQPGQQRNGGRRQKVGSQVQMRHSSESVPSAADACCLDRPQSRRLRCASELPAQRAGNPPIPDAIVRQDRDSSHGWPGHVPSHQMIQFRLSVRRCCAALAAQLSSVAAVGLRRRETGQSGSARLNRVCGAPHPGPSTRDRAGA
jgi:hypothetical protein